MSNFGTSLHIRPGSAYFRPTFTAVISQNGCPSIVTVPEKHGAAVAELVIGVTHIPSLVAHAPSTHMHLLLMQEAFLEAWQVGHQLQVPPVSCEQIEAGDGTILAAPLGKSSVKLKSTLHESFKLVI